MADNHPESEVIFNDTYFFSIEKDFEEKRFMLWLRTHYHLPLIFSVVYLLSAYGGQKFMQNRKAFNLKLPMVLWNGFFAVFSLICTYKVIQERLYVLRNQGWVHSVCTLEFYRGSAGFWGYFLYTVVRVLLFGDTVFVVLRKKKLQLIHVGHHLVSLVFSWYMMAEGQVIGRWLLTMTMANHFNAFTYYLSHILKLPVPWIYPVAVYFSDIVEMSLGIALVSFVYLLKYGGYHCDNNDLALLITAVAYATYIAFRAEFMYNKFFKKKPKKKDKTKAVSVKKID